MRVSFTRYLLWVLLPGAVAGAAGYYLALQESQAITRQSTTRLGRMAGHLLAGEMADQAEILARQAPLLTDPDPASPLIHAAMEGDTVAALGTSSQEVTLSLALAEEGGDSLLIRATTAPFPAEALNLFASRTGRRVALYLRGTKAKSQPADFGGTRLPGQDSPAAGGAASLPFGSVILPLVGSEMDSSPAQLLVAPQSRGGPDLPPHRVALAVLLILSVGAVTWTLVSRGPGTNRNPAGLLALTGLPLLVLWLFLGHVDRHTRAQAQELVRGDMVRILALLSDGEDLISLDEIPGTSGFHVLRERAGEILATTLPPGPVISSLTRVPLPPPSFPTLGRVEVGDSSLVYAILREEENQGLLLTAPGRPGRSGKFRLLLGGMGGAVSLMALGFLAGAARAIPPDSRD